MSVNAFGPVYFCFKTAGVDKFFVGVSYWLIHRPFFHSIRSFFFAMCPCDIYYKMLLIFSYLSDVLNAHRRLITLVTRIGNSRIYQFYYYIADV